MSVLISPDSSHAIEMAKWNKPYTHQEYPALMYLAGRDGAGGFTWTHEEAHSQDEVSNLQSRGFGKGQQQAVEFLEVRELDLAKAAANRAGQERTMSPAAQAEAAAVDASTDAHVGVIPETPVRRRGRPRKKTA